MMQAVSQRDPKRAFSSVDNPEPPVRRAAVDVLLLDSRFEWQERVTPRRWRHLHRIPEAGATAVIVALKRTSAAMGPELGSTRTWRGTAGHGDS